MHTPIDRIPEHLRGMTDVQLETYKSALTVMSELTNRWELAHRAGSQYEGMRDIYEALGYKMSLSYLDYYARYERQDIAAAIIDRPVEATWKDEFNLVESSDDEFTPLEKAWKILAEEFDIATKFERLDTLACIGQYAVLLLGLDDVTTAEGHASPVTGKPNLLYLKPIGENNAQIDIWDIDSTSPRFGMPQIYSIKIQIGDGTSSKTLRVHHSRILHVVGKTLESEVLGRPMLQSVFNRLYDLEKTVGASAEMFWRGGRPGYKASVDENYTMSTADKDDLLAQIAEYEHNLRRILVAQGVSIESLAQQVADPSSVVDVLITMISAVTGIPKRILTGSERGELASSTDRDSWMDLIDARRNKIATKQIIRPFIDRCIEYGILPPVKSEEEGYVIEWPDSYALTEKDRVEIGHVRATALKEYATNPTSEDMMPLEAFLKIILGLDDDQIALIEEMREAQMEERLEEEERLLLEQEERERLLQEEQNKQLPGGEEEEKRAGFLQEK